MFIVGLKKIPKIVKNAEENFVQVTKKITCAFLTWMDGIKIVSAISLF